MREVSQTGEDSIFANRRRRIIELWQGNESRTKEDQTE